MGRVIQNEVQVANAALRLMGAPPISSFEDDSVGARTLRIYYDLVLRRCLSFFHWNFCGKQAELVPLPESPLPQFSRAYRIPPDFVNIRRVREGLGHRTGILDLSSYALVSGNILACDAPPPVFLDYTYEAPVAHYPHYFLELLISALVEECTPAFGYNLVGQGHYGERVHGPNGKLAEAIREERMQGTHRPPPLALGALGSCRNW
jgi:hypothetical protein